MGERRGSSGFALIAVLLTLSMLLALAVPFLISMGHGDTASQDRADAAHAEMISASARDMVLAQVGRSFSTVDETPRWDDRSEFPDRLELPESFADLQRAGASDHLLNGETADLQRRINLNTATPLVIANLLGTVTRLTGDHDPEADRLEVNDTSGFPETGFLLVDRELIAYGERDARSFGQLERGFLAAEGYEPRTHVLADRSLVLDYRAVLAVMHTFYASVGGTRGRWRPLRSVDDLARLTETGFPGFTPEELDILRAHCTVSSARVAAADWGPAERIFSPVIPGENPWVGRSLRVRSADGFAAGGIVRIRAADGSATEYGLCMEIREVGAGTINMPPPRWQIELLLPVTRPLTEIETLVEPLLPHPVNANTASPEVLTALFENMRNGKVRQPHGAMRAAAFGRVEAARIAEELVWLRGDADAEPPDAEEMLDVERRPFDGFDDLAQRYFAPRFDALSQAQRGRWLLLYRAMRTGNVGELEMGTAPLSFVSAPLVSYRAAGLRMRAGRTVARHERQGTAVVLPGEELGSLLVTQHHLEEAFRLDRRAPWYTTHPINLGAQTLRAGTAFVPSQLAGNPPPRSMAHVLPMAFPNIGLGEPRFASRDGESDGLRLAPAHTPWGALAGDAISVQESLWASRHPEGRDVPEEGPYELFNIGPRGSGPAPTPPATGPTGHQAPFPFTRDLGVVERHAVQFWFRPRAVGNDQMLFDLAADESDGDIRNRISLALRDQHLELRVFDEAGQEIEPTAPKDDVGTSPEITAGIWRLPLAEIDLRQDVWYHANFAADGNQPGQMSLLIDGMPPRDSSGALIGPELRTILRAELAPFTEQGNTAQRFTGPRYLPVRVESTAGFPDRGVLRIGLELFEYTRKDASTFYCDYDLEDQLHNSTGGRLARMDEREFGAIPATVAGQPPNLGDSIGPFVTPEHPVGAAVELYGYSLPAYRDTQVLDGVGRLVSPLGPWAVARMMNTQSPIQPQQTGGQSQPPLGRGLHADDNHDVELADPVAGDNPAPASQEILDAFPATGGYALLVQHFIPGWTDGTAIPVDIGGIELIRYQARAGNRLTGVQRGALLPQVTPIPGVPGLSLYENGQKRSFVGEWTSVTVNGVTDASTLTEYITFVVPISIPVQGSFPDPSLVPRTEWVQLYPEGRSEVETEWVRYDVVAGNNDLVRANAFAWQGTYHALTRLVAGTQSSGALRNVNATLAPGGYAPVTADSGYIGYIEAIEERYPAVQAARLALGFRGDPATGTSSHRQESTTLVLPAHRFELAWGNHAALHGRAGRNDRVALVGGEARTRDAQPGVEWHTVNWTARFVEPDRDKPANDPAVEYLGPDSFQLVAFKDAVGIEAIGQPQTAEADVRLFDRLVKFPSGELPAAAPEEGLFGASQHDDVAQFGGILDELHVVQRESDTPSTLPVALLLDATMQDNATEFVVRPNVLVQPQGIETVGRDLTADWPQAGLVAIDGEILAFSEHSGGRFTLASNGRGLLRTTPTAHNEAARVTFLPHVPAAVLASPIQEGSHEIVVEEMGALPPFGGTLLVGGTELLHYTWSTGNQLLEMPQWFDPKQPQTRGRGLLRGRYGTAPVSVGAGEAVVWFPFRYWDRQHERADDPELAHFQFTWNLAPVWFRHLAWFEGQSVDELVDLQCLVRIDGQGSFAGDPDEEPGLFLLTDGDPGELPNPLMRQGSRLEARFFTVYKPGSFDPDSAAHSWKWAPTLQDYVLEFEGQTRILDERVTAR